MNVDVLEAVAEKIAASGLFGRTLDILWHAGEPLAVGAGFYETAFKIFEDRRPDGVKYRHQIQTNGTLIDEDWCRLFVRHDVQVGVSVDGPPHLNDRHRVTRGGKGTSATIEAGIGQLLEHNVKTSALCVLGDRSLDCIDEIFDYFEGLGVRKLNFNPEEVEGINAESSLAAAPNEKYAAAVRRLFDRARTSDTLRHVREYENAFRSLLSSEAPRGVNTQNRALAILAVDCHGNLSTFSPELLGMTHERFGDFVFGNILTDAPEDILASDKFQQVDAEIQRGVERCRAECEFFPYCGGGAPSNKLFENGTFDCTETLYCRMRYKIPLTEALEFMETEIEGQS